MQSLASASTIQSTKPVSSNGLACFSIATERDHTECNMRQPFSYGRRRAPSTGMAVQWCGWLMGRWTDQSVTHQVAVEGADFPRRSSAPTPPSSAHQVAADPSDFPRRSWVEQPLPIDQADREQPVSNLAQPPVELAGGKT